MKILVTGARGFVGRNLVENLKNIRDGKDRTRNFSVTEVFEYDIDSSPKKLDEFCQQADFVFNLAGVNRPKDTKEFQESNFGFASTLLETLKKYKNNCPVMLSNSIQATLIGRYGESDYGRSKLAGENLFFEYSNETGARVLVYRFPNLFGKWCRPNYNSVVATFCHNMAHDLPIQVNDPSTQLELLYIDDLIDTRNLIMYQIMNWQNYIIILLLWHILVIMRASVFLCLKRKPVDVQLFASHYLLSLKLVETVVFMLIKTTLAFRRIQSIVCSIEIITRQFRLLV